ncbi:hypothetical protein AMAG_11063 [Allomyces macrogynus ATCC 38327]|uniref:Transcription factor domain-containing protein n=1 Tax=Allomyces macrogynus (strain ATCC 38327) TaxID=578462 RepID=A0A0L0SST1_ALLM3|nr:hypothetical protein AMAG_11063 [Allomyces macrogynus ATCC 38327]|eukprot:KNE65435.1 hypothetical protein AMAG_11063 [Allomyces macrogynus ATCC 38327]
MVLLVAILVGVDGCHVFTGICSPICPVPCPVVGLTGCALHFLLSFLPSPRAPAPSPRYHVHLLLGPRRGRTHQHGRDTVHSPELDYSAASSSAAPSRRTSFGTPATGGARAAEYDDGDRDDDDDPPAAHDVLRSPLLALAAESAVDTHGSLRQFGSERTRSVSSDLGLLAAAAERVSAFDAALSTTVAAINMGTRAPPLDLPPLPPVLRRFAPSPSRTGVLQGVPPPPLPGGPALATPAAHHALASPETLPRATDALRGNNWDQARPPSTHFPSPAAPGARAVDPTSRPGDLPPWLAQKLVHGYRNDLGALAETEWADWTAIEQDVAAGRVSAVTLAACAAAVAVVGPHLAPSVPPAALAASAESWAVQATAMVLSGDDDVSGSDAVMTLTLVARAAVAKCDRDPMPTRGHRAWVALGAALQALDRDLEESDASRRHAASSAWAPTSESRALALVVDVTTMTVSTAARTGRDPAALIPARCLDILSCARAASTSPADVVASHAARLLRVAVDVLHLLNRPRAATVAADPLDPQLVHHLHRTLADLRDLWPADWARPAASPRVLALHATYLAAVMWLHRGATVALDAMANDRLVPPAQEAARAAHHRICVEAADSVVHIVQWLPHHPRALRPVVVAAVVQAALVFAHQDRTAQTDAQQAARVHALGRALEWAMNSVDANRDNLWTWAVRAVDDPPPPWSPGLQALAGRSDAGWWAWWTAVVAAQRQTPPLPPPASLLVHDPPPMPRANPQAPARSPPAAAGTAWHPGLPPPPASAPARHPGTSSDVVDSGRAPVLPSIRLLLQATDVSPVPPPLPHPHPHSHAATDPFRSTSGPVAGNPPPPPPPAFPRVRTMSDLNISDPMDAVSGGARAAAAAAAAASAARNKLTQAPLR